MKLRCDEPDQMRHHRRGARTGCRRRACGGGKGELFVTVCELAGDERQGVIGYARCRQRREHGRMKTRHLAWRPAGDS